MVSMESVIRKRVKKNVVVLIDGEDSGRQILEFRKGNNYDNLCQLSLLMECYVGFVVVILNMYIV